MGIGCICWCNTISTARNFLIEKLDSFAMKDYLVTHLDSVPNYWNEDEFEITYKLKPISMKNFLLFLMAFTAIQVSAQNTCSGYYITTKGAMTEYNLYDGKNQLVHNSKNVVKDLQTIGTDLKIIIETLITDKKGKADGVLSYDVMCKNNEITVDMRGFMSPDFGKQSMDAEVTIGGDGLIFPGNPQVGQKLKDSNNEMKITMGKVTIMNLKITVQDYVIEAKETITTPAGTFETFKATYLNGYKSLILNGTSKVTIWFAKGVGIVKQEVYNNKNGKLESKMELVALKK